MNHSHKTGIRVVEPFPWNAWKVWDNLGATLMFIGYDLKEEFLLDIMMTRSMGPMSVEISPIGHSASK